MSATSDLLNTFAEFQRDGSKLNHAEPTAVYIYLDAENRPLYVGITRNHKNRHADHMLSSNFRNEVARREVFVCATRRGALDAEAALIRIMQPKFNKMHRETPE